MRHLLLVMFLMILSCTPDIETPADLVVINANIYIQNGTSKSEISQSLLNEDADIYILLEAHVGHNVDSALFVEGGYELYDMLNREESRNSVVATRVGGVYGAVHYHPSGTTISPFSTLRIPFDTTFLSIIGVHVPAPYFYPKEEQEYYFSELKKLAIDGRIADDTGSLVQGDMLLMAGDFNSFPSDDDMRIPTNMGLVDGAIAAGHPYQFTWSPRWLATDLARIDYLFASPDIKLLYQTLVDIPGTDHKAVKTGVLF